MPRQQISFRAASPLDPVRALEPVTPDDANNLPGGPARGLFVGEAGSVAFVDGAGNTVTLQSGDSQYHPVTVVRVIATGTTAGGILALY